LNTLQAGIDKREHQRCVSGGDGVRNDTGAACPERSQQDRENITADIKVGVCGLKMHENGCPWTVIEGKCKIICNENTPDAYPPAKCSPSQC
jgi:hypothetical protein